MKVNFLAQSTMNMFTATDELECIIRRARTTWNIFFLYANILPWDQAAENAQTIQAWPEAMNDRADDKFKIEKLEDFLEHLDETSFPLDA